MSPRSTYSTALVPPRVFISHAHDPRDPGNGERVLGLANELRGDGVDARLDLYEPSPAEGWPKWCEQELLAAAFVLVVCTARYRERFEGAPMNGQGLGVQWEGLILRQLIYEKRPIQVVPVLLSGASVADVPVALAPFTRRELPAEYHDLYRQITGQHAAQMPALGELRRIVDNLELGSRPPVFAGREEELAEIRKALAEQGSAAVHLAIVGLGGVGKTRLALEYARASEREYDVRWRLRASGLASAQEDLVGLGMALRILSRPDDIEASVDEVRQWLSLHQRWLLVFDNADKPDSIRSLLPSACPGHVLITSRAQVWRGLAVAIVLRVLPPAAAQDLLLRRSGRCDDGHVDALAKALGYLPLALVQAAAYIEATGESFGGYRELFEESGVEVFNDPNASPGEGEDQTVARTWAVSFAKVRERSGGAAMLLEWLAFLNPDGVKIDLLIGHPAGLPEQLVEVVSSRGKLNSALAELLNFSLVERDGDVLRVHRLVQQASREALGHDARNHLAIAVLRWVHSVFTYVPLETPVSRVADGIAEQVMVVVSRQECEEVEDLSVVGMLADLGHYFLMRGMTDAALEASQSSVNLAELLVNLRRSGHSEDGLAVSLSRLGAVKVHAGDISAARDLFLRSLQISEKVAEAYPDTAHSGRHLAISLEHLGELEARAGNLPAAHNYLARSLQLHEVRVSANPEDVEVLRDLAVSLNNIGAVELLMNDLVAARGRFIRDVAIAEAQAQAYPDSPRARRDLTTSLDRLGDVEARAGDIETANRLFLRSMQMREELVEADPHNAQAQRDLSISLSLVGRSAAMEGDPIAARRCFLRALRLCQALAAMDPLSAQARFDIVRLLNSLALLAEQQEDGVAAAQYRERAHLTLAAMDAQGQIRGGATRPASMQEVDRKSSR